jgi:thiamine-phosphate pyrophosphorylase
MKGKEARLSVLNSARLYAILDGSYLSDDRSFQAKVGELLSGGVRVFQLRLKGANRERVERLCALLSPEIKASGGIFILNDYVEWACDLPVDGVHVGQDDMPVDLVREMLGRDAIIGLSTHNLEQVRRARDKAVDYIGFGPIFATETKPDYLPIGLECIGEAKRIISARPVFCIGGINLERLPSVLEAGGERVVMVSALLLSDDSSLNAQRVIRMIGDFGERCRR